MTTSVASQLLALRDWHGSLDDLATTATRLVQSVPPTSPAERIPEINRSLVKDYRIRGIVDPADGKLFRWRHLVQVIVGRCLVTQGWSRDAVATWRRGKEPLELLDALNADAGPQEASITLPTHELGYIETTVSLLARGVLEQFQLARSGAVTIHDASLSPALLLALRRLSALQVGAGQPDTLGSTHSTLALCTLPLTSKHWGIDALDSTAFPYQGVRLLDPDALVPTLDCVDIGSLGHSELDLREKLAFEQLRAAVESLPGDGEPAYSAIREFIVRHPTTTPELLRAFLRERQLLPVTSFLSNCYSPVGPQHRILGRLHSCPTCGTPMRASSNPEHARCVVVQCADYDRPKPRAAVVKDDRDVLVVQPHIQQYWVGPGLDEVAVFDLANDMGLQPRLYPDWDACDVSLDRDTTGVDIKSHASPFVLARALSKSIGRLAAYETRIIAINDRAVAQFPGYLDLLRGEYRAALAIDFMTVTELKSRLREAA